MLGSRYLLCRWWRHSPRRSVAAQFKSSSQYGSGGIQAPDTSERHRVTAPPTSPQAELARPEVNVSSQAAKTFESNPILSLPNMFARQWSLGSDIPPEGLISERYLRTQDTTGRSLSLKEAIYIAIRNNPGLTAVELDPIAATESVVVHLPTQHSIRT